MYEDSKISFTHSPTGGCSSYHLLVIVDSAATNMGVCAFVRILNLSENVITSPSFLNDSFTAYSIRDRWFFFDHF